MEWFLNYGSFAVYIFLIAVVPQVWRNLKFKKYASGSIWTWILFLFAHCITGLYMFFIGELIMAIAQVFGFMLCITIILQRLLFESVE